MTRKKMQLLMGLAVAAVGLALPAVASAAWTDGTVNVEYEASLSSAGTGSFTGELGGFTCSETFLSGGISPGTTGTITEAGAKTASCKGTGGLGFCTLVSITAKTLPWTTHTNGSNMSLTGVHFDFTQSGAFCPYHELKLQGNITSTPNNLHAATTATISGTLNVSNGTTGAAIGTITPAGTLNATPSGTYGIT